MIKMEVDEQVDRLSSQRLGEQWIGAILEGALDRLQEFCDPSVTSFLLTPKRLITLSNAADLLAKYHQWFDQSADFRLEGSRVQTVGDRLGIFYAFLLQEDGEWYRIEQQLYCTLNNGRVEVLHLLCSGFQPVRIKDQSEPQV